MSKGTRVFVGNLPHGVGTGDIQALFDRHGRILQVDLKSRSRTDQRGPPFAFVEFEDPRDAEDAVSDLDGLSFKNSKIRVEFPREEGRGRGEGGSFPGDGIGRPRPSSSRSAPTGMRRSAYRVLVSGLPLNTSWQDLKDHMRDAGEVCYADIFKDGSGMVEFLHQEGVLNAVKKMNGTKIRSFQGDSSTIIVKEEYGAIGGGYRARSRSRSRSYSPPTRRRRSPSRSRPRGRRSPSSSRSRSRSNPRAWDGRY
jgi:arginine/serine-rich splicing factor 1/9